MIKKLDPSATFTIICEQDSALVNETPEERRALIGTGKMSRYQQYLENLDESKLQMKEGETPTYFKIRCLANDEIADLQERHYTIDTVTKTMMPKNTTKLMFEYFNKGVIAMLNGKDDKTGEKITSQDLPINIVTSLGATISVFSTLSKNLKNG